MTNDNISAENALKEIEQIKSQGTTSGIVPRWEVIDTLVNKINKDKKTLDLVNEMKRKYKIALFMIIRNSIVLPKGLELGKTDEEINKMSYETLCEVLLSINFKVAEKKYEEGKKLHEMDNIILIIIITAYTIYKIIERVCDTIDMQKDSEEYKAINRIIDENIKLTDTLLAIEEEKYLEEEE